MVKPKQKKKPSWRFGICLKPGSINTMDKNGKLYHYPKGQHTNE